MKLPFRLNGKLAKTGLMLKNSAPEICVAGSIILGVGCVVTSCMATLKSEPIVSKTKEQTEALRRTGDGQEGQLVKVSALSKEKRAELNELKRKMVLTVAKNFAIPMVLGAGSIALNIGGNRILRKNLAAVTVAYAGLLKSYNEYRKRVIADLGKEKDQEYLHGLKKTKGVEIDPNTGEVVNVSNEYDQANKSVSQYARWFDEGDWDEANKRWIHRNTKWCDDNFKNQKNLRSIEREANDKLVIDGFLFLNDVYRMLGLPLSIDGQIVGWTYNGENGDHAVSFGVFDDDPRQLPVNHAFVDGKRNTALLDFNVDGPIINDLENFFGKDMAMKIVARAM